VKKNLKKRVDANSPLFDAVFDTVREVRPKITVLENVPGLTKQVDFMRVIVLMKEWGYEVHYGVLNSMDYGIPHHRKRLYIVGIHQDVTRRPNTQFKFPPPHVPVDQRATLLDIIARGKSCPQVCVEDRNSEGDGSAEINGLSGMNKINEHNRDEKGMLTYAVTSEKPIPEMTKCLKDYLERFIDTFESQKHVFIGLSSGSRHYGVPSLSDTVSCLTTNCKSLYCVPERRFATGNELLLLQGFDPENFVCNVSKARIARQVGNTMTVHVLQAIFRSIFEHVVL
jgi:DNA-cytosine methyltransferase